MPQGDIVDSGRRWKSWQSNTLLKRKNADSGLLLTMQDYEIFFSYWIYLIPFQYVIIQCPSSMLKAYINKNNTNNTNNISVFHIPAVPQEFLIKEMCLGSRKG